MFSRKWFLIPASILLLNCPLLQAGEYNTVLDIGDPAPAWENLPGVDGKQHSLSDLKDKELVVVVFHSCSCGIAESYEERIKAYTKKYAVKDGRVAVVAINVSKQEKDRPPAMKKRAKEHEFNFPYLFDESQTIAREFGALWTPEFFILDRQRKVVYMGSLDDRIEAQLVKHRYLEDATDALLSGGKPEKPETPAFGCLIKLERQRRESRPVKSDRP